MAVAASLSRGLGKRLALIPAGSKSLDPASFAVAAVTEQAGLIVISAPWHARALAVFADCPVIVVPAIGPAPRRFDEGPVVCALDRTAHSGHVARLATRFALQVGATLRLVHIDPHTRAADVPAIAKAMSATLLVISAYEHGVKPELALEAAEMPVMRIPVGVAQSAPQHGGELS